MASSAHHGHSHGANEACGVGGGDAAAAQQAEGDLAEFGGDVTALSCCERDRKEQARASRIKGALLAVDPTMRDAKMRAAVLPTFRPPPLDEDETSSLGSSLFDEDDDDPALAAIREARLEEMARAAREQERRRGEGLGTLLDVDSPALMEAVGDGSLVCHLPLNGAEVSAQVDEYLEALAVRYNTVRFVRAALPKGSPAAQALGIQGAPCVVCCRDGLVLRRSEGYGDFGGADDFREEALLAWLKRAGVLSQVAAAGGEGADEGGGSDDDDDADDDEGKACEQCGRSYPHEHIRGLRAEGAFGSGSDEDEG